jgi:hypothetical protein
MGKREFIGIMSFLVAVISIWSIIDSVKTGKHFIAGDYYDTEVYKSKEPFGFWAVNFLMLLLAILCIYSCYRIFVLNVPVR